MHFKLKRIRQLFSVWVREIGTIFKTVKNCPYFAFRANRHTLPRTHTYTHFICIIIKLKTKKWCNAYMIKINRMNIQTELFLFHLFFFLVSKVMEQKWWVHELVEKRKVPGSVESLAVKVKHKQILGNISMNACIFERLPSSHLPLSIPCHCNAASWSFKKNHFMLTLIHVALCRASVITYDFFEFETSHSDESVMQCYTQ